MFSADPAEVEDQASGYGPAVWSDPRGGETHACVSRRSRTAIAQVRLFDDAGTVGHEPEEQVELPAEFRPARRRHLGGLHPPGGPAPG